MTHNVKLNKIRLLLKNHATIVWKRLTKQGNNDWKYKDCIIRRNDCRKL